MSDRIVFVSTSPRVAPGLLTAAAWDALRAGPVLAGGAQHPHLDALRHAGVDVEIVDGPPAAVAHMLREHARGAPVAWLAAHDEDDSLAEALRDLADGDPSLVVEVLSGSYDLPGARLLDVVATMDRLRSPGGCPWDAEQTHETLAPYLLEEAYEAYEALEEGDLDALREELGDVLLQVAFHARVAQEDAGWTIDDVAQGLVDKLVRRHPHVFADVQVSGAQDVVANWDVIKTAEKRRTSVTDGVALSQPALTLAATLQRKASKVGLPAGLLAPEVAAAETPGQAVSAAAAVAEERSGIDTVGELLWAAVLLARMHDVDPEAALRGRARGFRDRLAAVERAARAAGLDPKDLDVRQWEQRWAEQQ